MARPDENLRRALKGWRTVRVTDMRGVDLDVYRFNYDLTMAVLLMHPDGTTYASYAGRDFSDASSHQSTTSLARVLDQAMAIHRKHTPRKAAPTPKPTTRKPTTVETLPWWRNHKRAQSAKCFHCHQIHDAWQYEGRTRGTWTERDQFTWPDPDQLGLRLDREGQVVVTSVAPASPSAKAGLRRGDRITMLGARRTIAFGDLQRALEDAPWQANRLPVVWRRGDKPMHGMLRLADGWKRPEPKVYAWRPMKWPMTPRPGFGGRPLTADEKRERGLPVDRWAFRVTYLVNWGPAQRSGKRAEKAGIRKGTIVHAVDGKNDFTGMDHFHAWFRMTRRAGEPVRVEVIQNGTRRTLTLTLLP